jgi:nucleoside phosphorylase
MPDMGMISAAAVASNIRSSFERIKVGILVGVCGGVPRTADGVEILLGDVIISTSVTQIDFGRQYPNKFIRKNGVEDTLGRANPEIRAFIGKASGNLVRGRLKEKTSIFSTEIYAKDGFYNSIYPGPENDKLYPSDYQHKHWKRDSCNICADSQKQDGEGCELARQSFCAELGCNDKLLVARNRIQMAMGLSGDGRPITIVSEIREAQKVSIHFGRIACSNQVMKSGQHRDRIAADEGAIAFEMESAGI